MQTAPLFLGYWLGDREKMKKTIFNSLAAGLMIAIGGSVFLGCEERTLGAILFTVGLISVVQMNLYLYTGKIGFVAERYNKHDALHLLTGLVGNYIAATLCGLLVSYALPKSQAKAADMCAAKLGQNPLQTFILGIFCGVLMYFAIKLYKKKTMIGVLFAVPVFIVAGFEHSIADMFYFAAGRSFTGKSFLFLFMVVLGNTVGAMILPMLKRLAGEKTSE